MRIDEVGNGRSDDTAARLLGLAEFLMGRAKDTAGQKQISMQTFLNLARNMQIDLTAETLTDMAGQAPLNGVFMPIEPNSGMIRFKGNDSGPIPVPVNQAQDIVAAAAKRAMK
jgi:hypothetical protein